MDTVTTLTPVSVRMATAAFSVLSISMCATIKVLAPMVLTARIYPVQKAAPALRPSTTDASANRATLEYTVTLKSTSAKQPSCLVDTESAL